MRKKSRIGIWRQFDMLQCIDKEIPQTTSVDGLLSKPDETDEIMQNSGNLKQTDDKKMIKISDQESSKTETSSLIVSISDCQTQPISINT